MAARWWAIAGAGAVLGSVGLAVLVHPHVGSGRACEGIGFGCTPERDTDTLLIVAVYVAGLAATLALAWWRARRWRPWRAALVAGLAITVLATTLAVWSQLPRYTTSPGPLSAARERLERVLADGEAVASPGQLTAAALSRWADRLRARGLGVDLVDPGGDPASDRRLRVDGAATLAGGALSVRASTYISQLEITASTGCHRS